MRRNPNWDRPRRLAFLAILLTTFGCSESYDDASYPDEPVHREVAARHVVTHPERASKAREERDEKTASTIPATPIAGVVGLDERQLRAKLGPPSAQNDQHPGTRWVYRDTDCILQVSLYPDVGTHAYKALGYEVTSNARTATGQHRCAEKYAARIRAD